MELLRPRFGIKTLIVVFFFALPLAAQTRAELDKKYGSSVDGVYRVRQGIAVEATFSENGNAKSFRILPDNPKDEKARLRIDDVQKLSYELLGGRMCYKYRPRNTERIDIECPPKKGCFGVKEEWKTHTVFLAWHKESVLYVDVTLLEIPSTPAPGNMKLLPGYVHTPGCGIDTSVGEIQKVGGMKTRYDIGRLAGNVASRYANASNVEWARSEKIGNDTVVIVLTKQNYIVATFEKENANFFATISSQTDIDDFLKMVLTYKPTSN